MFWRMASLSTTHPVESLLDKEGFTLEELLDENELIQECKALNPRLMNFLRGKSQIQQLVKYIVEEPEDGCDCKRAFKYPYIACEIITCEIEVILKNLVEDEQIMDLLFSFLEPDHSHGVLLAGYFSKVVITLLGRKPKGVMRYLKERKTTLKKFVDLISITSIMEVVVRLVEADNTMRLHNEDWLSETDILELIMDKLSPHNGSEEHANAASTLTIISGLSQSKIAAKLASPSVIAKLFHYASEEPRSQSALVHCLSVCISILEPKKYVMGEMGRLQQVADSQVTANLQTIDGMLQKLGDLLQLLDVGADEKSLPTTYGELHPPLGTHRLKIIEFLSVLIRANSETVRKELVRMGAIQQIVKLFFDYPFNNSLHHHVGNIILSCIDSNRKLLVDHILVDCDLVARLVQVNENPFLVNSNNQPTRTMPHKVAPKAGNLGHLTRIANKLLSNADIRARLQENPLWLKWQTEVLQKRNSIENIGIWTCGRPNTVRDWQTDIDDERFLEKDPDISMMASNLTRGIYRYGIDNEDSDEGIKADERDDDDVFFDEESAKVVISSLRFRDQDSDHSEDGSVPGANWFSYSGDRTTDAMEHLPPSNTSSKDAQASTRSKDEVFGEDKPMDNTMLLYDSSGSQNDGVSAAINTKRQGMNDRGAVVNELGFNVESLGVLENVLLQDEQSDVEALSIRPALTDWRDLSTMDTRTDSDEHPSKSPAAGQSKWPTIASVNQRAGKQQESRTGYLEATNSLKDTSTSNALHDHDQLCEPLFDGTVQFVGVEIEGTAKAMEYALREGIVGEAGPILPVTGNLKKAPKIEPPSDEDADPGFSDVNYWKSNYGRTDTELDGL
ncbi:hypothetical protein KP509_30G030200 [Ceratopteris richardii]|uniref:SIT4 phosphatase-associated family protein n=1 Tax=Ceratopteris richardii TaxID=49495 RepID=A0A8T2R372_CERRI|nr:hypothetical protein KP509_30G030200 [Ceratopteris richardii]KAH7290051.1 hypothetical protein KP509_30G030200 [Ceratopteris richardii]KAH7290055.1 hypothetical protein KP509_30G030200 [Ceratopteris richardii]KAH7290057.1 hypothetical protein KP509_30G030200 [Ceratopteris richardii]